MPNFDQPFNDVQALAQRVVQGKNFDVDLEIFTQFADGLRLWVLDNFDNYRIRQLAQSIPEIDYNRKRGGIWGALGASGIRMYKQHQEREEVKEKVRETARIFDAIHRLIGPEDDELV